MLTLGLIYLAAVIFSVPLYYLVHDKYKSFVLFISSAVFVALLSFKALLFAIILTLVNYFAGILLEKYRDHSKVRVNLFWLIIVFNAAILVITKAFGAYIDSLFPVGSPSIIDSIDVYNYILIPLGVSYYCFQALGYLIRINRGAEKAERNIINFSTYLIFYPKFISGPVLRSNHFLPQLKQPAKFNKSNLEEGIKLILWGLLKKVVIANNLMLPVTLVYGNLSEYTGIALLYVLLVQAFYIYFDFSGYTDMALGMAGLFGLKIMDNFNRPFLARSVTDYWRRWHISLSSWTNDFIYSPFIVKYRQYENATIISGIFLTFFIVGIWHGLNWTFVILGILQGIAIVYEYFTKKYRFRFSAKLPLRLVKVLSRMIVFLFISISLVFFFSGNVSDAAYFLSHLFTFNGSFTVPSEFFANTTGVIAAFILLIVLMVLENLNENGKNLPGRFQTLPVWMQWFGYAACLGMIIIFYSDIQSFYYMRF